MSASPKTSARNGEHVMIAGFLEVRHDDFLGVSVRRVAREAELLGGPQAEQLVAARVRLEEQFFIMGELLLEAFLTLVEGAHARLVVDGCSG